MTVVKRQTSKKTGAEYARLTLEDFHGTAEALVFPEAWAKLNGVITPDGALLLTGGYSARDRGEEQAPFIVEAARPLDELRPSGAIGVALRWTVGAQPDPETARAIAALCAAHPGPTPLLVEWGGGGASDGNGESTTARLRSRSLRVDAADDLLAALRDLLGADRVHLVRAS
jgi:DNA polymerase-3 subunit alpha